MSKILLPTSDPDQIDESKRRTRPIGVILAIAVLIAGWTAWPDAETGRPQETLPVPEPFSPPVGEWREVTFTDLDGGFTAIAKHGDRLAAVGTGLRVDSPPFAYWSVDGEAWNPASGPWERGEIIVDILSHDSGFAAIGHAFDVETLGGTGLRLWTSTDGKSWERVSHSGLHPDAVMTDIAFADGRFMAIGYEGRAAIDPGFRFITPEPARVWTSVDGTKWADETPASRDGWFGSLIATSDGEFAIGGLSRRQPMIWRSGEEWFSTGNSSDEYRDIAVTEIVEHGSRLIAMSQYDSPEGPVLLWAVDDEGNWTGLVGDTKRPQSTRWMTLIGGDLFAGPPFSRAVFTTGPELWVSDSGRDWFGVEVTRGVSPWPPAAVSTTVEWGDRLLAFGSRGGMPTVWTLETG